MRFALLLLLLLPCMAHAEPTLVDRVMDILGRNGVGSVEVKPDPATVAAVAVKTENKAAPVKPRIEIAHNYLPVYLGEDDENPPLVLPFYSSAPLERSNPNITNLVIMIHDADREAARAFAFARSAGDEASSRHPEWLAASSFIFAPQMLGPEDILENAGQFPDAGKSLLRWPANSWIDGNPGSGQPAEGTLFPNAANPRSMTSFDVLDYILLILSRPQFFPNLQHVVIAGTGAGGNFVQRYAVLGMGADIMADRNIDVHFAVMQARSFLYLDKNRARLPLIKAAEMPSFAEPPANACPPGNLYPFGFDNLPLYAKKQGENDIRLRYGSRSVVYLVSQNSPDLPPASTPEACAFTSQGKSALERAQIYYASLQRLYGDELTARQRLVTLPALADDGLSMWRSECSMSALFADGACKEGIRN